MRSLSVMVLLYVVSAFNLLVAGTSTETLERLPESSIVVSQGGATLTLADVDLYAKGIPAAERAQVFDSPTRIETILRSLLVTKQLAREMLNEGSTAQPTTDADYSTKQYQVLSRSRMEELRNQLESQVPDMSELAYERYLADPDAFVVPRKVDVQHILISTKKHDNAAAKELAEKLYKALIEDPARFSQDVDQYSDDKSKRDNHGLIEFANSDRTVKEFREAAESLQQAGDMVGPVKTAYGYHILKAIHITPAHKPTYDEVRDELIERLRQNWVNEQVQNHVDELRSKKIDANPEVIASLRTRYLNAETTALGTSPEDAH